MPVHCCTVQSTYGVGHAIFCPENPNAGKDFLSYPDGIGDVRFHYFNGQTFTLKRVQFETIGGDPNGHISDVTGDFENGELFHVPNVAWWEVVYQ